MAPGAPAIPPDIDPVRDINASVMAKYAEVTGDTEGFALWNARKERIYAWANENDVELHPEWLSPRDPGWGCLPWMLTDGGHVVPWV